MAASVGYGTMKQTKLGVEESHDQLNRIRITLSSLNVKNLVKVFTDLVKGAKDKQLRIKGHVRMIASQPKFLISPPTNLHAAKVQTPGIGLSSGFTIQRVLDLISSPDVVKQITSINIEPGVEVEVTIADV